jgi:hypothetical protein
MKTTVGLSDFRRAFSDMGRENNFSWEGLAALFEYLEGIEEGTGEEIELDVIALCCDYTEYQSIEEFRRDYGGEYETIEDIEQQTTVIPVNDDAFIVQAF